MSLIRCIRADFYKLKRTFILWLHLSAPLAGALVFLVYYQVSGWDTATKLSCYLEALSIAFPMMIGLVSAGIAEQEEQAGSFQVVLVGTPWRLTAYISKLMLLLFMAFGAVGLAVGVFALGFRTAGLPFYVKAAGALLIGNAFLYMLHLFVSFRFGKGASIGLGIAGSLITALMLTGLGDGNWYYVPWAWSVRWCDIMVYVWAHPCAAKLGMLDMGRGLIVQAVAVSTAFLASLMWFENWEGKKSYD